MRTPKIAIIGSINLDLVTRSERFPKVGETLLGSDFQQFAGGKGANQAVAAARLGADVALIGAVGNDDFGRSLLASLQQEGINTDGVKIIDHVSTGIANITVAENDNHIIVISGANFALTPEDIDAQASHIAEADIVLSQLEIPLPCVIRAAQIAKAHGKPFLLNPAPAQILPSELIAHLSMLTPNAYELALSLGLPTDTDPAILLQHAPVPVVMTRGSEGAWFTDAEGNLHCQPTFAVDAVDTTGAGDTFNGALAVFWHYGLAEAVRHACAAAALSVTRHGAQTGMPTRQELEKFIAQQNA